MHFPSFVIVMSSKFGKTCLHRTSASYRRYEVLLSFSPGCFVGITNSVPYRARNPKRMDNNYCSLDLSSARSSAKMQLRVVGIASSTHRTHVRVCVSRGEMDLRGRGERRPCRGHLGANVHAASLLSELLCIITERHTHLSPIDSVFFFFSSLKIGRPIRFLPSSLSAAAAFSARSPRVLHGTFAPARREVVSPRGDGDARA